jgi:[ribosomal protein S5]-alanine N-acetyltransferase
VNETPTLSAAGIVLRSLVPDDAPALHVALSDPNVQRYRHASPHTELEETESYILNTLAMSRAAWAITEDGGEALGRLALRVPEAGIGELGIVLRAAAQGRGLGFKALQCAETFAFGELGLSKLTGNIDAENAASLALFAKAGFTREALLTANRITDLGLRDSVLVAKPAPQG